MNILNNPLTHHTLLNRRKDWRFNLSIVLTLLAYSPLSMTIGYGIMLTVGFILFIVFSMISYLFLMVYAPQQANEEITLFLLAVNSFLADFLTVDGFRELVKEAIFDLIDFLESDFLPALATFIFYTTTGFLLMLIILLAPTMSASLISSERQRQTFDFLLITRLSARAIVVGKLTPILIYVLFPIAAIWTLLMLCYSLHGPSLIEVIIALVMLTTTAIAFATIGIFISTIAKTITGSMMLIYGGLLPLLFIAPTLVMLPLSIVLNLASNETIDMLLFYGWGVVVSLNPVLAGGFSTGMYYNEGTALFGWIDNYPVIAPWLIYTLGYTIFSWLLLEYAIWRVNKMGNG